MKPDPQRVVSAYLVGRRAKTAGEVRHVKDNSGDASTWAYSTHNPIEREMDSHFDWDPVMVDELSHVLRSTTAAMGHAINAQNRFAQLKSRNVSPDGRLGGRGYIQRVADMRRQLFNVVEALSALSDTLYDEVHAPHWASASRASEDTQEVLEQTDKIRDDPAGWAEEVLEEDEEDVSDEQ